VMNKDTWAPPATSVSQKVDKQGLYAAVHGYAAGAWVICAGKSRIKVKSCIFYTEFLIDKP
jgi:hypothetical protein